MLQVSGLGLYFFAQRMPSAAGGEAFCATDQAPRFIDDIYATLVGLNRDGLAMLIVEQNVEAILAVAHRVFVLDLGRNAFDGTPAELRGSDRIRRLYLGEDEGEPA